MVEREGELMEYCSLFFPFWFSCLRLDRVGVRCLSSGYGFLFK